MSIEERSCEAGRRQSVRSSKETGSDLARPCRDLDASVVPRDEESRKRANRSNGVSGFCWLGRSELAGASHLHQEGRARPSSAGDEGETEGKDEARRERSDEPHLGPA